MEFGMSFSILLLLLTPLHVTPWSWRNEKFAVVCKQKHNKHNKKKYLRTIGFCLFINIADDFPFSKRKKKKKPKCD